MASESVVIDYASVLADLKSKRDALNAAIAGIEGMIGQNTTIIPSTGSSGFSGSSPDVQSDTFFNMSIADAAKKFLAMKKAAQSTQDIADALEKGGMTHTSENWANTVGSVLNRINDAQGDIAKVKRGTWGLAIWYPGRKRSKPKDGEENEESGTEAAK